MYKIPFLLLMCNLKSCHDSSSELNLSNHIAIKPPNEMNNLYYNMLNLTQFDEIVIMTGREIVDSWKKYLQHYKIKYKKIILNDENC